MSVSFLVEFNVTSVNIHLDIVRIQWFNVFPVSVVEEGVPRDAASHWWLQNKGECSSVLTPNTFAISGVHFQSCVSYRDKNLNLDHIL